jgi:Haem-NO-binding
MHGLVNRSIQHFLTETYGADLWREAAAEAVLPPEGFEAMLTYEDAQTFLLIDVAAARLRKPAAAIWEDYGMFLVTLEPLRRLMRFSGVDYGDFLASLDELHERAELAVEGIGLPQLSVEMRGDGRVTLRHDPTWPGFGLALAGVLRAMADDYGALALIEPCEGECRVEVELLDAAHSTGRDFVLSARGAA